MESNINDINRLTKEAQNNSEKQVELARLLYSLKSYEEAFYWYEKAAALEEADGWNGMGCCYLVGRGVNKDEQLAIYYFEKAATKGSARAMCNLADYFSKLENSNEAFYWYEKAAKLGFSHALKGLGCCYLFGRGIPVNKEKAKELFEKAASQGSSRAMCYLAAYFYIDKELDLYTKAASMGDYVAEYHLGQYYMHQHLGSISWEVVSRRDTVKAFEWFMKSALKNYSLAQYEIGLFYEKGVNPCIRNTEKALYWYTKAANNNYALAMYAMGRIYANGEDDVTPNYSKAYSYYLMAADRGLKEAQFSVGIALLYGKGVNINEKLSYKYLLKAALQGHPEAQYQVSLLLLNGIGVEKDEKRAVNFLRSINDIENSIYFKAIDLLNQIEDKTKIISLTEVSVLDLSNAKMDSYGVLYSSDGKRLLKYSIDDNYESFNVGSLKQQTLNYYEIPDSVEIICDGAFEGCESIQNIKMPTSIKQIGDSAFRNCINLESINLPEGIETLQAFTFEGCTSLYDLCLPKSLKIIEVKALNGVRNVESKSYRFIVKDGCLLSEDLKKLIHFFNDNRASYKIPNYVEIIGEYAFSECGIYKIDITPNVRRIEDSAFMGCPNLEFVNFEYHSNLKIIEASAFANCRNISYIYLPAELERIGIQSFSHCSNLESVIFPTRLKEICNCAFEGTAISSVVLPKSLEVLGIMAFTASNIEELKSLSPNYIIRELTIFDKTETKLLQYYGRDQKYIIPSHVESIGDFAFACAWSIKELTIPNTVKHIGKFILDQTLPQKIWVAPDLYDTLIEATDSIVHSHIEIYNNDRNKI